MQWRRCYIIGKTPGKALTVHVSYDYYYNSIKILSTFLCLYIVYSSKLKFCAHGTEQIKHLQKKNHLWDESRDAPGGDHTG